MPSDRDFSTCLCLVSTSPEVKCWVELVFKIILVTVNIKVARKSLGFVEWVVEWLLGFLDLFGFGGFLWGFLRGACVFSILS